MKQIIAFLHDGYLLQRIKTKTTEFHTYQIQNWMVMHKEATDVTTGM